MEDQPRTATRCGVVRALVVNPRLQFERDFVQAGSDDALSEEGMLSRNVSLLQGQEYQNVLTSYGGSRWYLMAGEPENHEVENT